MEQEREAVTAVEPKAVLRNSAGQFVPGGGSGKPRGTLQKITKIMKQQLSDALEEGGERGNPLIILLTIARNEEEHGAVRVQAADRLLRYVQPQLLQIQMEQPEAEFEVETEKIRTRLRSLFSIPKDSE